MPVRFLLAALLGAGLLLSSTAFGQNTTVTFQKGGANGTTHTLNRGCFIRNAPFETSASVVENGQLDVGSATCGTSIWDVHALVDFPAIIGTGGGAIPPGATIASATLRLWCLGLGGGTFNQRVVSAKFINDWPERRGTWTEPAVDLACTPQFAAGVSWLRRDSRPTADIPWSASPTLSPLLVTDPALLAAFPGVNTQIIAGGGGAGAGQWHAFTVTRSVQLWASGLSNQGWILSSSDPGRSVTYASDDYGDATRRPQLVVTWSPGPPPPNRVPRVLPTIPPAPATPQGVPITIILGVVDDDGGNPEFVLLNRPQSGELRGVWPYLTYTPRPEFTGQDTFSWAARDALSISFPQKVVINVSATSGTQSVVLQEGVTPTPTASAAQTRSCSARWSSAVASQATFEDVTFKVEDESREGFLDFPNLIGTGTSQIPSGSRILSARLEMTAHYLQSPGTPRTVFLHRIIDPLNRGTSWREPAVLAPDPPGCNPCGVTYYHPDSTVPSQPWNQPGGDVHPADVATLDYLDSDVSGVLRSADVTAAVQAWADGQPNHGWALRSRSSASPAASSVLYEGDSAAVPATRPRLSVCYRPPSSGNLPGSAAPYASAGPDQRVYSHHIVILDARATRHPNGLGVSTTWIQIAGPPVTLAADPNDPPGTAAIFSRTPRFVAPPVGAGALTLEFVLAARAAGVYALDNVRIHVTAQPGGATLSSPTANAGPDRTVTEISPVTLSGASTGGTGQRAYRWTKLSGPPVTLNQALSATCSFTAPAVGAAGATLVLDLEVTDNGSPIRSVAHDQVSVHILNSANAAPTAHAGPSRSVDAGKWVVLDGSGSVDPEGQPLFYTWTQLSGPAVDLARYVVQGTPAAVTTPFEAPAGGATTSLVFRLTVSDSEASGTATVTITVVPLLPAFSGAESLAPYRGELTDSEARHLLRRMGMGWHPDDVDQLVLQSRTQGFGAFVDTWVVPLDRSSAPVQSVLEEVTEWAPAVSSPSIGPAPYNQPTDPCRSLVIRQIEAAWLTFALRSPNAFIERLVQFWHDRLACSARGLPWGKLHWGLLHADLLRFGLANVPGTGPLGNYRTMLLHFARDAMTLSFIDGFDNRVLAPNENFGREFMELHTLGILGASGIPLYTENDVQEAARAFTGWVPVPGVAVNPANLPTYSAVFNPSFHDSGLKVVLGSPATNFDDQGVVNRILDYDGGINASRWLSRGLLEHFVTGTPSPSLIDQLAIVIRSNAWQVQPVVRTLLKSQAMFSAGARKAIVKSPVDLARGALKTLRVPQQTRDIVGTSASSIIHALRLMGHQLGNPVDVNGWPQDLEWVDDYATILRTELARRILVQARSPSAPSTLTVPLVSYPDHPGHPVVPVDIQRFLPPAKARFADETLRFLLEAFDVTLRTTPAAGAPASEFVLARQLLETVPLGTSSIGPCSTTTAFNGDCPEHLARLWSCILLLMEHPEFQRL